MRYPMTMLYIIMLVGVSVVLYQYRVFITWISTQSNLQNTKLYPNSKYTDLAKREVNRTVICTERELTTQLPYTTLPPYRSTEVTVNLAPLYIITPTYRRPEQLAELTRLSHTLMLVPSLYWLVIEDGKYQNPLISQLLNKTGIPYSYLIAPMPEEYKKRKKGPKPRGVSNRNKGLQWVRTNAKTGVLYFADDDNTYDLDIFNEMRSTKKVSMWPVGLITKLGVSSPVVKDGRIDGFYDGWIAGRTFPVDMAGFAVSVEFLLSRPKAIMPFKPGYEEDGFLKSLSPFTSQDIELLASNCTKYINHSICTSLKMTSALLQEHNVLFKFKSIVCIQRRWHKMVKFHVFIDTTPLYEADPPITSQPQNALGFTATGPRRPIPVSTIDWESTRQNQFMPRNGLDFLDGVEKLYIQQTVELTELLANVDSENRYTIKVPMGETLYYASESSTNFQRFCCGPNRAFVMRLYDQTQQEALQFRRRLAFGNCSCWCYLQTLEIWLPPGEMIGFVRQQMSLSKPILFVYSQYGELIYCIEGPDSACCCINNGKDKHFKIYNAEATTQLGSINHQWDQVQVDYILCLQFPNRNIDTKTKAILLGSAFLLEYMYFERSKMSGFLRCSC